ncbi:MAG: hypothetical protein ACYSUY_13190 [Planctomycetota bacterium]
MKRQLWSNVALPWIILPLLMFACVFAVSPWILVRCTLGNPLFELFVDFFQIILRSDAVSRFLFVIVFLYCHMMLPTAIYYCRRNRRTFAVTSVIWTVFTISTVINAICMGVWGINLGKS